MPRHQPAAHAHALFPSVRPRRGPTLLSPEIRRSAETVWQAITDKDQMRQWFFEEMTDFDPVPGFETQFTVRV